MKLRQHVLGIVLAGGEGKRLRPLTEHRAKPAVPFGGQYRLVDFALSNLVNSGICRILVLTQYKSHSLDRHLALTWRLSPLTGNYVTPVPAQMRYGPRWFQGSADAIYQNLNIMGDEDPDHLVVLGSDHIYRMDLSQMLARHISSGAGVTVAGIRMPAKEAASFGVINSSTHRLIDSFYEKPSRPLSNIEESGEVLVSMGNYIFSREVLETIVTFDAGSELSKHDLGHDVIPKLVEDGMAHVYEFSENEVPGQTPQEQGYWRDVGTLDSYYQSSMDLIRADPVFDLYNEQWPIYSWQPPLPPAKFVHDSDHQRGQALNSLVSKGVIVSGGTVRNSILSPRVRVRSNALVEDSVLFDDVEVGRGAVIRKAIVDKGVIVPDGFEIGVDHEIDKGRFTVSEEGITVIGKKRKIC